MEFVEYQKIFKRMGNVDDNGNCMEKCPKCPLAIENNGTGVSCGVFKVLYPELAEAIAIKWANEHPVKTRQSEFLERYPNADINFGYISIRPCVIDTNIIKEKHCVGLVSCSGCMKQYWSEEV